MEEETNGTGGNYDRVTMLLRGCSTMSILECSIKSYDQYDSDSDNGKNECLNWSEYETLLLDELVKKHGTSWHQIATHFPCRTVNSVRNRWQRIEKNRRLHGLTVLDARDTRYRKRRGTGTKRKKSAKKMRTVATDDCDESDDSPECDCGDCAYDGDLAEEIPISDEFSAEDFNQVYPDLELYMYGKSLTFHILLSHLAQSFGSVIG